MTHPVYQRIQRAVSRIPAGRVCTYGEVARIAGASGARQVGYALHAAGDTGLPWHRVVNARGRISLHSSSGTSQRQLLMKEGVRFKDNGAIDLLRHGWVGAAR